jgi:hypothetical protein
VVQQQIDTAERKLARMASHAHGVVTRAQLLRAGISAEQIRQRLRRGALLPVYRGVYRVGHRAPSVEANYMAAVLACGEGSLLSGMAAAHVWGLVRGGPPVPEVLASGPRRLAGVRISRARRVDPRDATSWRGIPITTVARTLVDVAACLSEDELGRAWHEASVRHRVKPAAVEAVLARRPNSPGAATLRRVMYGETPIVLSRLEKRFLARLREAGLPVPRTNRLADARYVDCRWPARRLTVELDGYRYHNSRHAWEQDRRRERDAYARGDQFRRYTWRDVAEDPGPMLAELNVLLRP